MKFQILRCKITMTMFTFYTQEATEKFCISSAIDMRLLIMFTLVFIIDSKEITPRSLH